jgi:hypothetical protein
MGIEDGAVDGASERASEADTRYGGGYGSVPVSPRSENGERLRWEGRGSVMRIGTRTRKRKASVRAWERVEKVWDGDGATLVRSLS